MARKKSKSESVESESLLSSMAAEEELELPEELEEALLEMEQEMEEEPDLEPDAEEEELEDDSIEASDEEDEEEIEEKAPRKRASRKKKAPTKAKKKATRSRTKKTTAAQPEVEMDEAVIEEDKPAKKPAAKKPKAPKPRAAAVAGSSDDEPVEAPVKATKEVETAEESKTAPVAAAAVPNGPMVQQWASVKDISESISKNFERVNDMLKEIPERQKFELQKIARQTRRAPWATRVAVAASVLAVVLSVVSLSLVSSMRRAMIMGGQQTLSAPQQPAMAPPTVPSRKTAPLRQTQLELVQPAQAALASPSAPIKVAPKQTIRKKASVANIKWKKRGYLPANVR